MASCGAQDSFETPDFNVPEALLRQGVNVSALPELAGLVERSSNLACSTACRSLNILPGFEVLLEDSTNYTAFTDAYWSTQQAEVNPICIFKPLSSKQVSIAILISRLTRCPFAVKGGGHAAFEGSSSIEGGITIALEKLNEIKVTADKKSVYVGPGNRWGQFYTELEKHGVAVVGGRVNDVGVSGLTLGGGISFFANMRGWACDNVESYELVTASGLVLTVTRKSFPDLYWALRGGGNNFGIVTKFQLHTFPIGKMWGGSKLVASSDFENALDATYNFGLTGAVNDNKGSQIISFANQAGYGPLAQAFLTYSEPSETLPSMFKDWSNISLVQDTTGPHSLSELVTLLSTGIPDGVRETYWDVTFKLDRSLFSYLVNTFFELLPNIVSAENLLPTISIQLLTIPQLQQMQKHGGNALGISTADGPMFIMNLGTMWTSPADDARIFKFNNDIIARVREEASKKGLNNDYIYMNYASGYQAVISSYGDENQKRLKSVAEFYDPTRIFQELQPGYFKLDGGAPLGTFL
ncbi:FAD-binding domain-containing protein [Didymella exigua CBS 183.55]|uniref:FAD-binding domain-containing protein n=1 Tax=Didymella exigua CBS 183.55 TaxID=1150837 RepID=A0A6A5R5A8_9PLEO|nr:FAD-binding domain-containing protein [Didymella exigua CBS 183.55]KAF1922609.1 FAD-binding domain-containing protein [Didymella exigua CBS 183.55]